MRDEPDDLIDELLRDHLRRELNPHLGKAERAVVRAIRRLPRGRWMAVWAAGAIAASLGIGWGVTARLVAPAALEPSHQIASTSNTDATDLVPIERQVVQSRSVDEGTVIVGNAGPARQLRQEELETTTFYDQESHTRLELTVPRERTMLIGLETY